MQWSGARFRNANALKCHLSCASFSCGHMSFLHPHTDSHCRNPWIDKAKATADFGDDEYMVRGVLHTRLLPYDALNVMR